MIICLAPIEAFVGAPRRERLPKAGLASKKINNLHHEIPPAREL